MTDAGIFIVHTTQVQNIYLYFNPLIEVISVFPPKTRQRGTELQTDQKAKLYN